MTCQVAIAFLRQLERTSLVIITGCLPPLEPALVHLKQKLLLGQHTPQVEVAQLHVGLDQLCSCFTRDMLVQKTFRSLRKTVGIVCKVQQVLEKETVAVV